MVQEKYRYLEKIACQIRIDLISSLYHAGSGHPGGSLSSTDLFAYLYFKELNVNPKYPKDPNRDRFVLSKGHCCPGLYSALAEKGFFPKSELKKLRHNNAMLQGHPDMKSTPGIDMSTGSLGQGISAACGMAYAGKMNGKDYRVYTILGDGELEEGQVWEASMFAGHNKLDNLCVIVDNNGLQIDGPISEICDPQPIDSKFLSFGFNVQVIDGHNFNEIEQAISKTKTVKNKPSAIICRTVKGKGVSFMENQVGWHGTAPNEAQYKQATGELIEIMRKLEV